MNKQLFELLAQEYDAVVEWSYVDLADGNLCEYEFSESYFREDNDTEEWEGKDEFLKYVKERFLKQIGDEFFRLLETPRYLRSYN